MDLICIPFAFPGLSKVRCAFQTRQAAGLAQQTAYDHGNISYEVGDETGRVRGNRETLRRQLGFEHWQECRQVHGDVMHFDASPTGWPADVTLPDGDGMATRKNRHALIIKTADCQPLLLAHRSGEHIAAFHVGWRGNRMNFPQSGVRRLCEHYGLEPGELMAVRGPSLGPGASEFVNFELEWGDEFRDFFNPETKTMDLWRLTREQLVQAGLAPENIFSLDCCTHSLHHQFFSYRRSRASGRQASFIWMEG